MFRNYKAKNAVASLATGLLALVIAASCQRAPAPARETRRAVKPRAVKTAPTEARLMERVVVATGSLAALERSTLASKVAGRLQEITVDLGSRVSKGQELARIEPRDYELRLLQAQAAVAQARAALGLSLEGGDEATNLEEVSLVRQARAVFEEARRTHERIASLVKASVASDAEFDKAVAEYTVASNRVIAAVEEARTRQAALIQRRAELEIARQQLRDTAIVAPYDGVIEFRHTSPGEYLNAGAPVVALVRTDVLRLRLEVAEREAAEVGVGQTVRFRVEGLTNQHETRITRLSPSIMENNRMLLVEADVSGTGLRPGAFVRGEIVLDQKQTGLAVPASALVVFAGLEKVVTVKDGKAVEREVVSGRRGPGWVEIIKGVSAGDPVVLAPGGLRTGDPVILDSPASAPPSPAGQTTRGR